MIPDAAYVVAAAIVGIGATAVLDTWSWLLKRLFGIPAPDFCIVGRWFRHMPSGTFRHANIAQATPMPGECATGWIAHYAIGVLFALGLVALVGGDWLERPTFWPPLLFGTVTVALPFFLMQPCFGFGIAASKSPSPARARLRSLASHVVFGIGLYLAAWPVSTSLATAG